ncbi:cyclic nucleotide-binding domain-containing protein [Nostoc sp.]|uniref:cyclic nucleotide-binding domain-containing protein n=1 Tax=Nostoc sp. TaxID=1180 RepID=UPI002FF94465
MGLLLDGKRIATVRVARNSEVKVMVIDEELFQLFLGNSELTKADIVRRLHQRVMTSHLSNALLNVEPSEIVAVAAQAKVIRYGANSIIIQEGEVAEKFYLILEGEVETLMSDRHDELTSCKLKPGEYFGNAQLVNGENYPFTVRAGLTEVEVMVIDRESFCSLILKSNTNQAIVASVLRHRLMNS